MKKTAADLYSQKEYFYNRDYQPILDSIVVQHNQQAYQGSTWCLYEDKKNSKYGYLCFGWGSCDALQACSNIEEIQRLMDSFKDSITWLDKQEMKEFLVKHYWMGDYSGKDGITFAKKAISYLLDQDYKEFLS